MSPRRKRTPEEKAMLHELSEEEMFDVSGGVARLRAKCPVPGCNFECSRMTEMNFHMRQCHPEHC
ncbi:MAG: hypothetical protein IJS42_05960 [Synergistaceae bacterium]|nr:hypothetical protein [Synergistaceae bacterium]